MAMQYLGEQLDIHTGGIDHIPVHHTNEIAQSEAATGKSPFVRYWVHHNFLQVEGEKMSKSLGNFFTIDDVLERGYDPRALRLLFLTGHYRSEMNFTWDNLSGIQKSYQRLMQTVAGLQGQPSENLSEPALKLKDQFFTALSDDLNTPQAVAVMWDTLKADLPDSEKLQLLQDYDEIFQLDTANPADHLRQTSVEADQLPPEVQELLTERQTARESGDWGRSDELRGRLYEMGYEVIDSDAGQQVKNLN